MPARPHKTRPAPAGRPAAPARPRWGMKALALGVSIVVALLLAEGVVRVAGRAPGIRAVGLTASDAHYQWSSNPAMGYELRPNVTKNPGTNSQGFVDLERPVEKPAGVRRILLLGDSVVEGFEEGTDLTIAQLMPQQLEKLFPGGKTQVLNFGIGGYCTLAEVELLRTRGLAYKPDAVVVVFVCNDFDNFNSEAGVLVSRPRPALVNWAFRNLHLARYLCVRFNLFDFASGADPVKRNTAAIGSNNVAQGLALLKELSLKHRFEPYLAVWPTFRDDRIVDSPALEGTDMLVVEALAAVNDIPTVRLSKTFDADCRSQGTPVNPRKRYTVSDGMHPNAEGCRVAAAGLKAMLEAPRPAPGDLADRKAKADLAARAAQALGGPGPGGTPYDYTAALIHYGDMLSASDPAGALRYYRGALQTSPDSPEAYFAIGRLHSRRQEWPAALEAFHNALRRRPGNPTLLNETGYVLWKSGQGARALEHFDRAIAAAPGSVEGYFNAAVVLADLKDYAAAQVRLRQALAVKPGDPRLLAKLKEIQARAASGGPPPSP